MEIFKKSTVLVVAFSLIASSLNSYAGPTVPGRMEFVSLANIEALNKSHEISLDQNKMAAAMEELESATDSTLPKKTKDVFFITNQGLIIHTSKIKNSFGIPSVPDKVYSLVSDLTPQVIVTNFEEQVKIVPDRSRKLIQLEFRKNNELIATHYINGFDVVASARDREFYTFVDSSGKIYTFDTALASQISFRAPIPVFEVGEMPTELITDHLQATYRVRGGLPNMPIDPRAIIPLDLAQDSIYMAGSFDIFDTHSKKYVGIYVRQGLRQFTYIGETILNLLAVMINPSEKVKKEIEILHREAAVTEVSTMTAEYSQNMDPALRSLIRSLPPIAIDQLTKRLQQNKSSRFEAIDKFTEEENQKTRDIIAKVFEEETKLVSNGIDYRNKQREYLEKYYNPEATKKTLTENLRNPKNLKMIAAVVAGALTLVGAYEAWNGVGPAWAVNYIHQAYDLYVPAAAKTAGYKVTTIFSTISMLMFMPLIFVIGSMYYKAKGLSKPAKKGSATITDTNFVRGTAKLGMMIWGTIALPFFHYIARLGDQPNFIRAMQYGINPLKRVATEEGIVRPGINVTKNNPNYEKETHKNALILEELFDKRSRQKALAQALAILVVGQEYGIDPATIAIMGDSAFTAEHLEKMAEDKSYRKLWMQTSRELEATLMRLQTDVHLRFDKHIGELDANTFATALDFARSTVNKIKARPKLYNTIKSYLPAWNQIGRKLFMTSSQYGVEESNYLKQADPSDFVRKQFFLQFVVDYSLSAMQFSYFSARSDMNNVPALAAKPTDEMIENYVSKNAGYTWDKSTELIRDAQGNILYDGTRYFLWTNPQHAAAMIDQVRIYGVNVPSTTALVYDKYRPIAEDSYRPLEELMYKGVPRPEKFLESIGNIFKDAINLKKADYPGLWLTQYIKRLKTIQAGFGIFIVEKIIGGQALANASLSYVYNFMVASILYGYWIWDPVQKGMNMRDARLEEAASTLLDNKVRLSQAIRFSQDKEMAASYIEFINYYKDSKTNFPPELEQSLPALEAYLNSGAPKMTPELRQFVKEKGMALLEQSKNNAPFPTKENGLSNWGLILFASVMTTYLGSFLDVEMYQTFTWGEKLTRALMIFSGFYGSTYMMQKLVKAWDRRSQETTRFKKVLFELLDNKSKSDLDKASSYLKMIQVYKQEENPLPGELTKIENDLRIFEASGKSNMSKDLKKIFGEKYEILIALTNKSPSYSNGKFNQILDKGIDLSEKARLKLISPEALKCHSVLKVMLGI